MADDHISESDGLLSQSGDYTQNPEGWSFSVFSQIDKKPSSKARGAHINV